MLRHVLKQSDYMLKIFNQSKWLNKSVAENLC